MIMAAGYDMNDLIEQGGRRWLKPTEVLFILKNHDTNRISHCVPHKPPSGSLFLFDKNVLSSFRGDAHNWKEKNGKRAKESHVQLKVDKVPMLNCYYAQGEDNPSFKRRCYWMLDGENKHIVLVHYMDEVQGENNPASGSGQSNIHSNKVFPFPMENEGSTAYLNDMHGSSQSVQSLVAEQQGMDPVNHSGLFNTSPQFWQVDNQKQDTNGTANSAVLGFDKDLDQAPTFPHGYYDRDDAILSHSTLPTTLDEIGSLSVLQEDEIFDLQALLESTDMDMETYIPDTGPLQMGIQADPTPTIVPDHKFNISEISPDWGFSDEATKVIIVGSCPCDPSKTDWACTFGDTEVPIQIIREGVICCKAPPSPNHSPGKVTLRITCRNQEPCSEVKEFEYRDRKSACHNCIMAQQEKFTSLEEVRLFARFVHMLLSNSSLQKEDRNNSNIHPSSVTKRNQTGCGTSSSTIDQVLQELLEDRLQQWLAARFLEGGGDLNYTFSKKEQGIIHIAAALGCDWALNPILVSGVGVNLRDSKGWTALHWAAQFGREKMVTALIKSGASTRVVTDPTKQEPMGRDPAAIANANGHKGLAGYLSELALTHHLSSLTLEEAGSVGDVSKTYVASGDDQDSMKQALERTVRAATLIQNVYNSVDDEYGFTPDVILSPSSSSKMHDHNVDGLAIHQNSICGKRHRGSHKLRRKAVKIQPQNKGNRVRKYKKVTWAVGILEKVALRWLRKGAGLRGYKPKREVVSDENEEDEDILKDFRKKMVDTFINEAISRVQFMIHCPEAQKQYIRMLEAPQQAEDIPSVLTIEEAVDSLADVVFADNDIEDILMQLPLEPPADSSDYSEIWQQ